MVSSLAEAKFTQMTQGDQAAQTLLGEPPMAQPPMEQTRSAQTPLAQTPFAQVANLIRNTQALPDPASKPVGALPDPAAVHADEERIIMEVTQRLNAEARIRTHYYVKIAVSAFLCALFLAFGIPVFMASRMTGSLSYTALGVVLIGFGFILAASVVILLFKPPFNVPKD